MAEWSSCNRNIASRGGAGHKPMEVAMIPLSQMLSDYGVPFYLKIDIEGNDRFCVKGLKDGALSRFISVVESEIAGEPEQLLEKQAAIMLSLLRQAGL
ncbi:MAG TPA: FkbM family methyltransferase [Bryobacteraceae bacterium]|nr:FkbM family methyltransferase [Bryobacteraceae bacterium]